MEGLAAVASSFAVASIAIQLAENIKKLHSFWDLVQDAPQEVKSIVQDLRLLERILDKIRNHELAYGPDPELSETLNSCASKVNDLLVIVDQFQLGLSSTSRRNRKWSALRVGFRFDTINRFRKSLEEVKSTLILATLGLSE